MPELMISPEKVGFLIEKARQFDVKEAASDPDSGSNAADDDMIDVLEDDGRDPVARDRRFHRGAERGRADRPRRADAARPRRWNPRGMEGPAGAGGGRTPWSHRALSAGRADARRSP